MPLKILLTSLSPSPRNTDYYLEQDPTRQVQARQSPLALLQLLSREELPGRIVVLCTKKIKKTTYPTFKATVVATYPDIKVQPVDIPDGISTHELWEIMHTILGDQDLMPSGCRLTLDLTHGFRSFPFIFFTAALYLKALRRVQIDAAYYGIMEVGSQDNPQPKPIVDLSLILDMVEWFYATRIFLETGQAGGLITGLDPFIKPRAGLQGEACKPYGQVKTLRNNFENVANAHAQALPVEFGLQAEKLLNSLNQPLPEHLQARMPLPGELFDAIKQFIDPFVLPGLADKKENLALDEQELQRQANIIDRYMTQGYINNTAGLIREWMVSVCLYHTYATDGEAVAGKKWLVYHIESRQGVERKLGAMAYNFKNQATKNNVPQRHWWLARQWDKIGDLRNSLHHHGMRMESALLSADKLKNINQNWQEIKDALSDASKWRLDDIASSPPRGTLLITPLGLSKGLLYSALHHINPDAVFIISSADAAASLAEIKEKAGWGGSVHTQYMQDAFTGFAETTAICAAALPVIREFNQVVVNITGGTTAMQHIVQHIFKAARAESIPIRQVALVDRRDYKEQREQPYSVGELINLEEH